MLNRGLGEFPGSADFAHIGGLLTRLPHLIGARGREKICQTPVGTEGPWSDRSRPQKLGCVAEQRGSSVLDPSWTWVSICGLPPRWIGQRDARWEVSGQSKAMTRAPDPRLGALAFRLVTYSVASTGRRLAPHTLLSLPCGQYQKPLGIGRDAHGWQTREIEIEGGETDWVIGNQQRN